MIVYFDGHCNVCNAFVDFLIKRDRHKRLKYAPLQGSTAKARLPSGLVSDLSTMVFEDDRGIVTESTAAIRTIAALGGVYAGMSLFLAVPGFVRNWVYRFIANHRYLWIGRRATCRLATPEERAQFLD